MPGRGNGLQAPAYTPVADLDPQLADAMLDALRQEGVAAYAAPAPGRAGAYLEVPLPDRPTDRLWVDRSAADRARSVLAAHLPGMRHELEQHITARSGDDAPATDNDDDDGAWAAIVSSYDAASVDPVPRWPVSEDVPDEQGEPDAPGSVAGSGPQHGPERDATSGDEADDERDHYVPPPPPPLPRADPVTRLAWVGMLGGPVLLALAAIFGLAIGGWVAFLAVAGFVGGFVTLVARMKDRPPTDSGYDDGAVV